MGMYTQLHLGIDLKEETPEQVINILLAMSKGEEYKGELPEHEFFSTSRWKWLFAMDSAYFSYRSQCLFKKESYSTQWNLSVTSNIKNYEDEIGKFLGWIKPYIANYEDEFIGYTRYEEDENPILIYNK
jgi:hypothetical protein